MHLPHVPDAKVPRDVLQLQLGQLLLQDRDPLLMGCRGRGRASPPWASAASQRKGERKHPGEALAALYLPGSL